MTDSEVEVAGRERFCTFVEGAYGNDDGVHWEDGVPYIHQDGRQTWLEEEFLVWQAGRADGAAEEREQCADLCDDLAESPNTGSYCENCKSVTIHPETVAEAIRARGGPA